MKAVYLLLFVIGFLFSGCFAPLNSVYDSAKLLEENEIGIAAGYSKYYGTTFGMEQGWKFENLNDNFGLSIRYGLSDKLNLNCRYEYMNIKNPSEISDTEFSRISMQYIEAGLKIKLEQDKFALQVPIGLYFSDGLFMTVIDPRLFYTISINDKSEFNLVPKVHIAIIGDEISMNPGLSLGLGLSSDLKKWALRPEVGIDGFFYFGIGFNSTISKKPVK